ncbi:MAG: DUF488 family protein [Steroidobacteraceae bacterium]
MKLPFFTVGHSNRSLEELIGLLRGVDGELVIDVRRIPRSKANPQFNKNTLPSALATAGVSYRHEAALGGRRAKAPAVSPGINGLWTNDSFHNYADYALSGQFQAGLERLLDEGRERRCAIMCSEAVWWRCHRRIITDYLIACGETVFHIMGHGRSEPAHLTLGAVVQPDGTVVYPGVDRSVG